MRLHENLHFINFKKNCPLIYLTFYFLSFLGALELATIIIEFTIDPFIGGVSIREQSFLEKYSLVVILIIFEIIHIKKLRSN